MLQSASLPSCHTSLFGMEKPDQVICAGMPHTALSWGREKQLPGCQSQGRIVTVRGHLPLLCLLQDATSSTCGNCGCPSGQGNQERSWSEGLWEVLSPRSCSMQGSV